MVIAEDRYGNGFILIPCQLPLNTGHDVLDEPTFIEAILDRLVHNAYRLEVDGKSFRKKDAQAGNKTREN
jgi:DNA replication protein DnaC